MAPSSYSILIALLVAFAVVAPSLPPSAAARDGGAAKAAAAPAASASGEVLQPMGWSDDLPLPRILPCPPAFPIKIPFIPCYNVTPSSSPPPLPPSPPSSSPPLPAPRGVECRPSLAKYMPPCAGFLTDGSSPPRPPSKCCGAIQHFFDDFSTTPLCLCHVANGDADKLLPTPANHTRALSVLRVCGYGLTPDTFSKLCAESNVPPMDAPTLSPPRRRR